MNSTSARRRRACDACSIRKVKCNGLQSCQQCTHLNLRCVYSTARTSRQTTSRGSVISRYRTGAASNRQSSSALLSRYQPAENNDTIDTAMLAPSSPLPREFFDGLVHDYVESIFPLYPIISEEDLRVSITGMDADQEHRSFVYALAAATISTTRVGSRHEAWVLQRVNSLCTESLAARKPLLSRDYVSVRRIMASVFIQVSLAGIQDVVTAWFHLREAMTMAQILRIDDAEELAKLDNHDRSQRQRLYWMLFVHERFLAIWDYRPTMFPPMPNLPDLDPKVPDTVQQGFNQIITLFRHVDSTFLENWFGGRGQSKTSLASTWIERKQAELDADEAGMSLDSLSEMLKADIIITRFWLRVLLWQMATSRGLLCLNPPNGFMSPLFPIRLAQSLRSSMTSISLQAFEEHGCRLLQKLFEIVNTIADVVVHVSASTLEEDVERMSDLLFLIRFLLNLCWTSPVRRQVLNERLETLCLKFLDLERVIIENSPTLS